MKLLKSSMLTFIIHNEQFIYNILGFLNDCLNSTTGVNGTYYIDRRCILFTTSQQNLTDSAIVCKGTLGKMKGGRVAVISRPNIENSIRSATPVCLCLKVLQSYS